MGHTLSLLLQQLSHAISCVAVQHICGLERRASVRSEPWAQVYVPAPAMALPQPGDLG